MYSIQNSPQQINNNGATKFNVNKNIDFFLSELYQIRKELPSYEPKERGSLGGRKITVISSGCAGEPNEMNSRVSTNKIEKLKEIQKTLEDLEKQFKNEKCESTDDMRDKISVFERQWQNLYNQCNDYLNKYQDILRSQTLNL